jgi:hypothetical protein
MSISKKVVKWHGQTKFSCISPSQNRTPTLGLRETLAPNRGSKQGELAGTRTWLKCMPKGWLVVAANIGNHEPVRVL